MRLTRYTHACVRLEHEGGVLVIDPGVWSEPAALDGVDAVLVTHEHADHVDRLRLRGLGAPVYAPAGSNLGDLDAFRVATGDEFTVAGFTVRAVGGEHATICDGEPDCVNLGYLVDGVYHPGDSLFVPAEPVATLLVPVAGPWVKLAEGVDFVRAVAPGRAYPIHDAQLNERGLNSVNAWFAGKAPGYATLTPGSSVEV